MNNPVKQSSNTESPVAATASSTTPTKHEMPYYFDADVFELQLDATPSQELRKRVSCYLMDRVSYERVMTASRFRLLHWMLALQVKLELA
jgi:hypothetical protein